MPIEELMKHYFLVINGHFEAFSIDKPDLETENVLHCPFHSLQAKTCDSPYNPSHGVVSPVQCCFRQTFLKRLGQHLDVKS